MAIRIAGMPSRVGGPEGDLPITLEESEARLAPVETGHSVCPLSRVCRGGAVRGDGSQPGEPPSAGTASISAEIGRLSWEDL